MATNTGDSATSIDANIEETANQLAALQNIDESTENMETEIAEGTQQQQVQQQLETSSASIHQQPEQQLEAASTTERSTTSRSMYNSFNTDDLMGHYQSLQKEIARRSRGGTVVQPTGHPSLQEAASDITNNTGAGGSRAHHRTSYQGSMSRDSSHASILAQKQEIITFLGSRPLTMSQQFISFILEDLAIDSMFDLENKLLNCNADRLFTWLHRGHKLELYGELRNDLAKLLALIHYLQNIAPLAQLNPFQLDEIIETDYLMLFEVLDEAHARFLDSIFLPTQQYGYGNAQPPQYSKFGDSIQANRSNQGGFNGFPNDNQGGSIGGSNGGFNGFPHGNQGGPNGGFNGAPHGNQGGSNGLPHGNPNLYSNSAQNYQNGPNAAQNIQVGPNFQPSGVLFRNKFVHLHPHNLSNRNAARAPNQNGMQGGMAAGQDGQRRASTTDKPFPLAYSPAPSPNQRVSFAQIPNQAPPMQGFGSSPHSNFGMNNSYQSRGPYRTRNSYGSSSNSGYSKGSGRSGGTDGYGYSTKFPDKITTRKEFSLGDKKWNGTNEKFAPFESMLYSYTLTSGMSYITRTKLLHIHQEGGYKLRHTYDTYRDDEGLSFEDNRITYFQLKHDKEALYGAILKLCGGEYAKDTIRASQSSCDGIAAFLDLITEFRMPIDVRSNQATITINEPFHSRYHGGIAAYLSNYKNAYAVLDEIAEEEAFGNGTSPHFIPDRM